jgi:hypothetical protein
VLLNSISSDDIHDVVQSCVENCGVEGADLIVDILRDYVCWNGDERPSIARQLLTMGHPDAAVRLARTTLAEPCDGHLCRCTNAVEVLISALGPIALDEVLHWLRRAQVEVRDLVRVMDHLLGHNLEQAACEVARRILEDTRTDHESFAKAADVLLLHDGPGAAEHIVQKLRARPGGLTSFTARLLPVLARNRVKEPTVALCKEVISDPGRTLGEIQAVIWSWVTVTDVSPLSQIMALVEAVGGLSGQESAALAGLVEEMGDQAAAVSLWCALCVQPGLSAGLRWEAAERLLQLGAQNRIVTELNAALSRTDDASEKRRLQQLLGWVTPLVECSST